MINQTNKTDRQQNAVGLFFVKEKIFFQKTLDICSYICYNNDSERETDHNNGAGRERRKQWTI